MSSQEFSEGEAKSTRSDIESGDVAPLGSQGGDNPQDGQGGYGYLVETEGGWSLVVADWGGSSEGDEIIQGPFVGDYMLSSMFWVTAVMCAIGFAGWAMETYFSGEESLQTGLSGECEAFLSSADIG